MRKYKIRFERVYVQFGEVTIKARDSLFADRDAIEMLSKNSGRIKWGGVTLRTNGESVIEIERIRPRLNIRTKPKKL